MSDWLAAYVLPYNCSTLSETMYMLSGLVGSSIFMGTSMDSLGRSANRGSTTNRNTAITLGQCPWSLEYSVESASVVDILVIKSLNVVLALI